MRTENIKKLLTAFYEGETSQEEELLFYHYFLEEQTIPDYLLKDKEMFLKLYDKENTIGVPNNLESKLNNLIDKLEQEEQNKGKSGSAIDNKKSVRIQNLNWRWVGAIAASILIVVTTGIFLQDNSFDNTAQNESGFTRKDTFTDPEDAYKETEKALLYASSKLNKGMEQIESADQNISRINKVVNKIIE